jgi:dsRNA-specific ribonuclease
MTTTSSVDNFTFNPYNSVNKEIQVSDVKNILTRYNVPIDNIHNIELFRRAFVHRSYVRRPHIENVKNNVTIVDRPENCIPLKSKSNERLEFLGDGVLENITKFYIYERFPKANEGFMTEKKIALVKNEHIGKLAMDIGLHKWFIISKHAEDKKTRMSIKKLGCLFEAFLGALFLDFNKSNIQDEHNWTYPCGPGFQMAYIFVKNVLERHVNWTVLIQEDDNFKNVLQVKIQKEFKITPTYIILDEGDNQFHMGVYLLLPSKDNEFEQMRQSTIIEKAIDIDHVQEIDSSVSQIILLGEGKHKIKKKAEQIASKIAIDKLRTKLK